MDHVTLVIAIEVCKVIKGFITQMDFLCDADFLDPLFMLFRYRISILVIHF